MGYNTLTAGINKTLQNKSTYLKYYKNRQAVQMNCLSAFLFGRQQNTLR
nr:MAG TPA: hypothetical protein [Caudoviricetes sp.]